MPRAPATGPRTIALFGADAHPNADGLENLHSELQRQGRPEAALVAVMGTTRVGKSWLSSYLAGQEGIFRSAPGMRSTTLGVEACTLPLENLARRFGQDTARNDERTTLIVGDLEGKGQNDVDHDFRLLLPVMLVSRAVVYVAKQGGTARQAFLDEMSVCVRLAESVTVDDAAALGDAPLFGALHVVFNEVTGDLEEQRAELSSWLQDEKTLRKTPAEKEQILDRNNTREGIRAAFGNNVYFHPLPAPSDDPTWKKQDQGPVAGLCAEYRDAAETFVAALLASVRTPRMLQSDPPLPISPRNLTRLLERVSASAFESNALRLPSLVDSIEASAIERSLALALGIAKEDFSALVKDLEAELEANGAAGIDMSDTRKAFEAARTSAVDTLRMQLTADHVRDVQSAVDKSKEKLEAEHDEALARVETAYAHKATLDAAEARRKAAEEEASRVAVQAALDKDAAEEKARCAAAELKKKYDAEQQAALQRMAERDREHKTELEQKEKALVAEQEKTRKAEAERRRQAQRQQEALAEEARKAAQLERQVEELRRTQREQAAQADREQQRIMQQLLQQRTPERSSFAPSYGGGGGYAPAQRNLSSYFDGPSMTVPQPRPSADGGIRFNGGAFRKANGQFASRKDVEAAGHTWKRDW